MTDPDPRPVAAAATDPAQPVTIADIAAFTTRHARLRPPALGGDPAEYTALLAHKAKLLARIADQHARTNPAHAGETREITERAQRAVTARHTADAHDTTNVKDLQSPSSPGWGISLSNTGEFRRASSRAGGGSSLPLLARYLPALRRGQHAADREVDAEQSAAAVGGVRVADTRLMAAADVPTTGSMSRRRLDGRRDARGHQGTVATTPAACSRSTMVKVSSLQ